MHLINNDVTVFPCFRGGVLLVSLRTTRDEDDPRIECFISHPWPSLRAMSLRSNACLGHDHIELRRNCRVGSRTSSRRVGQEYERHATAFTAAGLSMNDGDAVPRDIPQSCRRGRLSVRPWSIVCAAAGCLERQESAYSLSGTPCCCGAAERAVALRGRCAVFCTSSVLVASAIYDAAAGRATTLSKC